MLVSTLMTPTPMFVAPQTSLRDAFEMMTSGDIRHLPVVEHDALCGVVSDRDLLEALGGSSAGAPRPEACSAVHEVMARQPATLSPQDTVVSATVEFLVNRIGCLPVLDEGKLVGIVTEMDMLAATAGQIGAESPDAQQTVDQLMARKLHLIAPSTTLAEAFELMRTHRVRHLPVLDGSRLVGLLSDRDLRAAIGAGRPEDLAVSEIMSCEPLTVIPGTRVTDAAKLMALAKVSSLPVVRDDELVGLLSLSDVLERCLECLRDESAT